MADKTFIADSETQDLILAKTETINTNVDGVNTNVDKVKTDIAAVNTNVNAVNSRTTSMQSTLNTVNTNINTLVAGRAVKSVQRGQVQPASVGAVTVSFSTVNMSKSLIFVDNGHGVLGSSQYATVWAPGGQGTFWQVVEFY